MAQTVYDFDAVIDRHNTSSLKYDFAKERKGREDLLPLWVADMDFALPQEILEDIKARADHGIFGYTDPKPDYMQAIIRWYCRHHQWEIGQEQITVMPGVVYAIACAIRAFTGPGDAVIIQQPVYYPFYETIVDNHRKCINSQLIYEDGRYRMDYEDFEQKIIENQVRLFLLCNPHNPVGRVWTREELQRIGEICIRHNVIIFADEIHGDFTYPGYHYTPFASISEEFARHTVVGTSPSKTFNLAGLQAANIVVPDETLRRQLRQENAAAGYSQANTLGLVACQSAYEKGEEWHAQLLRYLTGNLAYVRDFLRERIPQIQLVEPEGTYLVWLDCRKLADNHKDLEHLIVEEAKLWLDPGAIFGRETKLFERINIACPRATLEQALQQLEAAVQARLSQ